MRVYVDQDFGYHMRGAGPWLSPRAGKGLIRKWDNDFSGKRGSGFFQSLRSMLSAAWTAIKKFVVPYLQESGPDVAHTLAKYAANRAQDYVKSSNRFGPAQGLVTTALDDLPGVVAELVKKQLNDRHNPLGNAENEKLQSEGLRGQGANMPYLTMQALIDARPLIAKALSDTTKRFQLIEEYGDHFAKGEARNAFGKMKALTSIQDTVDDKSMLDLVHLVQSMINVSVQAAEQDGLITPGTPLCTFLESACQLVNHCHESPDTKQFIDERTLCTLHKKGQLSKGICLLNPGAGDFTVDPSERGGFSFLLGVLAPLVGSVVNQVIETIRGSGGDIYDQSDFADRLSSALAARLEKVNATSQRKRCNTNVPTTGALAVAKKRR